MRAAVTIEDIRSQGHGGPLLGMVAGKSRAWVALVSMVGSRLCRKFLRPHAMDYSRANSVGSRGVFKCYWLETGDGMIYEVSAPQSWSSTDRYFCVVTIDGEISRVDRDYVESYA
jgi:hypothetical protein